MSNTKTVIGRFSDYQKAKIWIEAMLPYDVDRLLPAANQIINESYQYCIIYDGLNKPNGRTLTIPSPQLSENQAVITN